MAETRSHARAKRKAAGQSGNVETPLREGGRLDASSPRKATEVERSGDPQRLEQAAQRLKQ